MKNLYKNAPKPSEKTLAYIGMVLYRAANNTVSEELCKQCEETIKKNLESWKEKDE